jgi:hypothetical protein
MEIAVIPEELFKRIENSQDPNHRLMGKHVNIGHH